MYSANALSDRQAVLHERRRIHAHRKRIFFLILFLALTVGFFFIIRKPYMRIASVEVSGNTLTKSQDVKNFIESKISGYKMFLIPRDSVLFVQKQKITNDILKNFPRLSGAHISGSRYLKVTITEPIFDSMYCEIIDSTPKTCALLHDGGKIGSIAPLYSYPPFFTFYKSGFLPETGQNVITIEELDRIRLLRQEIEVSGIKLIGFIYNAEYDEFLLDTGVAFSDLPRIRLVSGATRQDISKTLGSAMKDENVKKLLLEEIDNLEYIDLRFSGQVVYRKKD